MQATKPQNRNKIIYCFFAVELIENYLGNVEIGFAESFSVERLDPLALSN